MAGARRIDHPAGAASIEFCVYIEWHDHVDLAVRVGVRGSRDIAHFYDVNGELIEQACGFDNSTKSNLTRAALAHPPGGDGFSTSPEDTLEILAIGGYFSVQFKFERFIQRLIPDRADGLEHKLRETI
jgi:hypothetical protein